MVLSPDELKALAKRIEDLAFEIPAPNPVTPKLASIAILMRNNAERDLAMAYQAQREWDRAVEASEAQLIADGMVKVGPGHLVRPGEWYDDENGVRRYLPKPS